MGHMAYSARRPVVYNDCMARNKKRNKKAPKTAALGVEDMAKVMRRQRREAELARGGAPRAWVAKNGKAEASKNACRGWK